MDTLIFQEVTPTNFLNALKGDKAALKGTGSGKVIDRYGKSVGAANCRQEMLRLINSSLLKSCEQFVYNFKNMFDQSL